MARIRLLETEETPEPIRQRLEEIKQSRGRVFNLYKLLANSPVLIDHIYGLVDALWNDSDLPRGLQELVILRVAQLTQSQYEWARHHALALRAGVPLSQINSLSAWMTSTEFDKQTQTVLRVVDQAVKRADPIDDDLNELKSYLTDRQVIELVALAGFYVMLAIVIRTLELDPEEGDEARLMGFVSADSHVGGTQ